MKKNKKQIYIVDDDESVCRALKALLTTYGFIVDVFTSSKSFFNAVPDSVRGCLILDIHMPEMDGWKTLKRILKSGWNLPVIFITADKNGGVKEKALKAGAFGYLQKPFNDKELVDLIEASFEDRTKM